jgi:hypothetical protein
MNYNYLDNRSSGTWVNLALLKPGMPLGLYLWRLMGVGVDGLVI